MSDQTDEAVNSRDWSNATVDNGTEEAMAGLSFRLPADLLARIFEDAEQQGVKPRALVRQIVEQHYAPAQATGNVAVVHLDEFRSELEQAVRQVVARTTARPGDNAAA